MSCVCVLLVQVEFGCGDAPELVAVREVYPCTYILTVTHPIACSPGFVERAAVEFVYPHAFGRIQVC